MIDTNMLLDKVVNSGISGGLAGGLAGGALTGIFMSGKGRKIAGSALKIGGVALAGGLAYKAYQGYRMKKDIQTNHQAINPHHADDMVDNFIPGENQKEKQQQLALLILKAMISSAKADGIIDSEEIGEIFSHINKLNLEADEKALLFDVYAQPVDINLLVADVDTMEQAIEVYAASLLVLKNASYSEMQYLNELADKLNLEPDLVNEIHGALQEGQYKVDGRDRVV